MLVSGSSLCDRFIAGEVSIRGAPLECEDVYKNEKESPSQLNISFQIIVMAIINCVFPLFLFLALLQVTRADTPTFTQLDVSSYYAAPVSIAELLSYTCILSSIGCRRRPRRHPG